MLLWLFVVVEFVSVELWAAAVELCAGAVELCADAVELVEAWVCCSLVEALAVLFDDAVLLWMFAVIEF